MESGDGGRNGQRVDVGSAEELGLTGIPTARERRAGRERADGGPDGQQRDCGVFGSAWAPRSVV
jgi:hypothetical protein